ncbi:MAG: gamma carbonic anhydrase family protein [bacterium]|jgi:carbonic anhydrase/acetyltransferase-like protein (isoleucine patch superfamily)|nr:gamma carbonic anhydrase family protein [Planctomycetota bacterium]HIL51225.1 gamma carbonic anhydrase family protein [Planctomycetota bacterium]
MTKFKMRGLMQSVEGGAWVAQGATVTGDVSFGKDANIWFGCVLRGDDAPIEIGAGTNIQDLTMVHCDPGVPNIIGERVTVGHGCVLHGAEVGDGCLIGMGAILLAGSNIGAGSIIGAGAVVTEGAQIPPRSLVLGLPGRVVREVTDDELTSIQESAQGYIENARLYAE